MWGFRVLGFRVWENLGGFSLEGGLEMQALPTSASPEQKRDFGFAVSIWVVEVGAQRLGFRRMSGNVAAFKGFIVAAE